MRLMKLRGLIILNIMRFSVGIIALAFSFLFLFPLYIFAFIFFGTSFKTLFHFVVVLPIENIVDLEFTIKQVEQSK